MSVTFDSPEIRADSLLRDVLGDAQYQRLRTVGYLDIPSRLRRGRVYRLDSLGNLSFRDPGESGFNTALCVQPAEAVPRDDQTAMRYLLATADEERLLQVANPITFGFGSLARAMRYDFAQRYAPGVANLLTAGVIAFFLAALVVDLWALLALLRHHPSLAVLTFVALLVPAFIGGVLVAAAVADVWRFVHTRFARRRLALP